MEDIQDLTDIRRFVDTFYGKIRRDQLLGPIFIAAIPGDWQPHLDKMYQFWNATLFSVAGFKGNPFMKHATLRIDPTHFHRWLELFNETIDADFEGTVAEQAKNRALLMARIFMSKLQYLKDGNGSSLI